MECEEERRELEAGGSVEMWDCAPCPWCGSVPHLIRDSGNEFQVLCVEDDCHVRPAGPISQTRKAARDRWNDRRDCDEE